MKKFNVNSITAALAVVFVLGIAGPIGALAAGPASVNLLSAGNFAILSKTGITNTGSHTSVITGNIGSSPITAAAMNNVFCSEITGTIYGVNAAYVGSGSQTCFAGNPPLANKTLVDNAVLDMGTAYADAAARTLSTATELGAGNIGGMTLAPGLYKWSTGVTIPTSVTLSGGANDVWIFQVAGNLSIASGGSVPAGIKVILAGGAQSSNVFWQVGGATGATLGTYSTFNGNILSAKQVIIQTGAVLNGRALARTQVTLDASIVTAPAVTPPPPPPVPNGILGGEVYNDLNRNGKKDAGEPGLVGFTVNLYGKVNFNHRSYDKQLATTTTDVNGNYSFGSLADGTYSVEQLKKSGWTQFTSDYNFVTVVGGVGRTNLDFGDASSSIKTGGGKGSH